MKKVFQVLSLALICIIIISACGYNTPTVQAYDPKESLCGVRVRYFPVEEEYNGSIDEAMAHQLCQDYLDGNLDVTGDEAIDPSQDHLLIMTATLDQLNGDVRNFLTDNRLRLVLRLDSIQHTNSKTIAHLTTLSGTMGFYKVKRSIFGNDQLSQVYISNSSDTIYLNSSPYAHYDVNLLYCFPADYTKGRTQDYYVLSEEPIEAAVSDTNSIQISEASDLASYRKYICIYELLWRKNEDEAQ